MEFIFTVKASLTEMEQDERICLVAIPRCDSSWEMVIPANHWKMEPLTGVQKWTKGGGGGEGTD